MALGTLIVGLTIAAPAAMQAFATTSGGDAIALTGEGSVRDADGDGLSPLTAGSAAATPAGLNADATTAVTIGGALVPPPIDKGSDRILRVATAGDLVTTFERMDYSFSAVQEGEPVPRVLLTRMPEDLASIDDVSVRKSVFFNVMLPLVLRVNEEVEEDRLRLLALRRDVEAGIAPSVEDQAWLADLAERYRADSDDFDTLVARVDIVPPSMALAQAAVESGWGTSEFTQRGNVLFGVITTSSNGIHGATGHVYAVYQRLIDATAGYVRTLNTHPAYIGFRALRSDLRDRDETLHGHVLMGQLQAYSELGEEYIDYIRRVIRINDLHLIDEARLTRPPLTETADLL